MRQIVSQTRVNGCIWVPLTPCLSCAKALNNPGLAWGLKDGAKRIRTADPLHAMQVLYQLSYGPV